MEAWKKDIVDAVIAKAATEKVISLKAVAEEKGKSLIARQDCSEIRNSLKRQLPTYRAVEKPQSPSDSLFQMLYFVAEGTEI